MSIRVIVADDNPAIRRSLCDMLKKHPEVKIIGEAENGKDAVERCQDLMPDIVTIDVHMPDLNGIEATRQIVSQLPQVKVLALSGDPDLHYVRGMLAAGASGYLLKYFLSEELVDAFITISRGGTYLSTKVRHEIISALCDSIEDLTKAEEKVLNGLVEGKSICDIALDMHLTPRTVYETSQGLLDKTVVSDVKDLAAYILREETK